MTKKNKKKARNRDALPLFCRTFHLMVWEIVAARNYIRCSRLVVIYGHAQTDRVKQWTSIWASSNEFSRVSFVFVHALPILFPSLSQFFPRGKNRISRKITAMTKIRVLLHTRVVTYKKKKEFSANLTHPASLASNVRLILDAHVCFRVLSTSLSCVFDLKQILIICSQWPSKAQNDADFYSHARAVWNLIFKVNKIDRLNLIYLMTHERVKRFLEPARVCFASENYSRCQFLFRRVISRRNLMRTRTRIVSRETSTENNSDNFDEQRNFDFSVMGGE